MLSGALRFVLSVLGAARAAGADLAVHWRRQNRKPRETAAKPLPEQADAPAEISGPIEKARSEPAVPREVASAKSPSTLPEKPPASGPSRSRGAPPDAPVQSPKDASAVEQQRGEALDHRADGPASPLLEEPLPQTAAEATPEEPPTCNDGADERTCDCTEPDNKPLEESRAPVAEVEQLHPPSGESSRATRSTVEPVRSVDAASDAPAAKPLPASSDAASGAPVSHPPPSAPPRRPARHKDRRGARRAATANAAESTPTGQASASTLRKSEARLRLAIDANRKSIRLSIVLSRPEGLPERIELDGICDEPVRAFDDIRYDDVDIDWTPDILATEIRLTDPSQQLQWLRSARSIHLFANEAGEPDLLSVPAASSRVEHSIICREEDTPAVLETAASTGSPLPEVIQGWIGIPAGWAVLTGYTPRHSPERQLEDYLRPLDPGVATEIRLIGGLAVRGNTYAEGHVPKILIEPLPAGCEVEIGSQRATQQSDGSWTAPGSDTPGSHLVDVVPGPSLTYSVLADPGGADGWETWDAHPEREPSGNSAPWAGTAICGARIFTNAGRMVVAWDSSWSALALGARANIQALIRRTDAPAAIGILPFRPAFLVLSKGLRRGQGKVLWLGRGTSADRPRTKNAPDQDWARSVRSAATRRLPIRPDTEAARAAWRSAKDAARRVWRGRV